MIKTGNRIFIFTDLHYGIHSNSASYIDICSSTMRWIHEYCKNNNIKDIIFMGDFFDSRASIDIKTLNSATDSLYSLANDGINVVMILGNHDIYLRDSTSIHSLFAFNGHDGITVVDSDEHLVHDGIDDVLLLPWKYGTVSKNINVPRGTKYVFCHHDFPANFFFSNSNVKKKNKSDTFENDKPYEELFGIQNSLLEEIIKNDGLFISGHIHQRKIIPLGNGKSKIIIEGSPYETSWGFGNVGCGGIDIDLSNGKYEFIENPNNKKHIEIRTSEIDKSSSVDFSKSIVRILVDTQESFDKISKLQSDIMMKKPFAMENTKYEFNQAEFIGNRNNSENPLDSISHGVSSKLDYINKTIDESDFSGFSFIVNDNVNPIDKKILKDIAKEIYDNIGEK